MRMIHLALQRKAIVTARSLAAELEVDRKTIIRDVAFMRDRKELPVDYDPVRKTYYYLRPVMAYPAITVSEGDVVALLVSRQTVEQYRGTEFHHQLAASFQKIADALPEKVSFAPSDELQAISFKSLGVGKADLRVFNSVSRALRRSLELTFDYRRPGETETTRRHVQPYAVAYRENLWYLVAYDHRRGCLRTFALPRISKAVVGRTTFVRPPEFSVTKYFAKAFSVFGGTGDYHIVLHFTGAAADRVRERDWHESEKQRELPDRGLELTLKLGALEEIERWVLSWGAAVRVVEPPELRARMAATVAALAREYGTPAGKAEEQAGAESGGLTAESSGLGAESPTPRA